MKKQSVGIAMLVYCLVFATPFLLWAISYGKSPKQIINDAIYYTRVYKIFPVVMFFSIAWLFYLVSSIGILSSKNWGKVLGIWATGVMTIWAFGYWLFGIYNDIVNPVILSGSPARGFGSFMGFFLVIVPIGLPSLVFFILLFRSQSKEAV
ncbi:MAG: hypothetical protein ACOY3D_00155 [Candidatus Omnitrophota bacterium]